MPAVQTSYQERIDALQEGQIVDQEPFRIVSRTCETAAGIGFGKVACRGANDNGIKVSEAGGVFIGFTVRNQAAPDPDVAADKYPQYSQVSVLLEGVIAVVASVAVDEGDPVYFVPATGVLTNVDGGGANTLIAGAVWDASGAQDALVPVRLNAGAA